MKRALIIALVAVFGFAALADAGTYRREYEKEFFLMPFAGDMPEEESACLGCHASDIMKDEYKGIPAQWKRSWHYQNDISCHDCHGGDHKDPKTAMSTSHRGFLGVPKSKEIPEFCGKCHIGVYNNYVESGHGIALLERGEGPSCVTCHGSHAIKKASMDIINVKRCSKCHTFERAQTIKKALFEIEQRITDVDESLKDLKTYGMGSEDLDKELFRTHAEFRVLFHTTSVDLVESRSNEFTGKLDHIDSEIDAIYDKLDFRSNFSGALFLLFAGMSIVTHLISKTYKEEDAEGGAEEDSTGKDKSEDKSDFQV